MQKHHMAYHCTIAGFVTLVKKDFMSFAHPFHTHCSHGKGQGGMSVSDGNHSNSSNVLGSSGGSGYNGMDCMGGGSLANNSAMMNSGPALDEGQISPIFIQILDCMYQMVQLYPDCFEFNTKYLLLISEHMYFCCFGNFLCDMECKHK